MGAILTNIHAYIVGVRNKKHAAIQLAERHEGFRGGKYSCEVVEWIVNSDEDSKLIRALPERSTLGE